jgi:hypothetical protein
MTFFGSGTRLKSIWIHNPDLSKWKDMAAGSFSLPVAGDASKVCDSATRYKIDYTKNLFNANTKPKTNEQNCATNLYLFRFKLR